MKYLLVLGLAVLSHAAVASSLESALLACQKISNDAQRLACFDQIQLQPQTAGTKSSTTEPVVAVKNQTVLTENDFGLEHKAAVKDKLESSVPMVLKKVTKTPFGLQIFSFENGQVWRQVSKETFSTRLGDTYILERGALNSFFLSEEGNNRKTRVRRDK
jgi:hypothetical protein